MDGKVRERKKNEESKEKRNDTRDSKKGQKI
jgi:hypothetical protein